MTNEISELFKLAAKYFFKKHKQQGGSQGQLAKEFGVTQAYLSSVMNGSRSASFDLYNQIAEKLYGPLDKFLAVGRAIQEGRDPLAEQKENADDSSVESLIARLTYYVMDHQRIAKELKKSKQFYETILENLQSAVLVTNEQHKLIYANRYLEKLTGIRPEQVIGLSPLKAEDAIAGLQLEFFIRKYREGLEKLKPVYFENIHVPNPTGRLAFNSGWIIPLIGKNGFNGMICTLRDTSDSHVLLSLLTHTIEHLPNGVAIVQQKTAGELPTGFFANKEFRKIMGLNDVDQNLPFPDLMAIMKKALKNAAKWEKYILQSIAENSADAPFVMEHKNSRKYAVTCQPIADSHGNHIGRISTIKEKKKKAAK